jgi:hypothetical protein
MSHATRIARSSVVLGDWQPASGGRGEGPVSATL